MTGHTIDFRVYYEDTDAGGIVYHARYLAFAERARTEAIRSLGIPVIALSEQFGLAFVVRDLTISYRMPLRLDDVFTVSTRLLELNAASCTLEQIISKSGKLVASLNVVLVCIHEEKGHPARFPPLWNALLSKLSADV
ncbi:tol-pal system-associated acyl-CoA thioesterase [Acetobacter thailandicus]|mgnify:CR=1 FL=1|uniref:tol-pal system-associated acyl-CoA thioesterase n=1 Tax=Acetobacter thailandicus TaxID=1502842 RepID=UPI002011DC43|nr:tol-pal system-associated acyl-CoA thioesterase [Acetobacter thailandicus]